MAKINPTTSKDVDNYIMAHQEPFLSCLQQLRAIIQSAAPKAEEMISYGVPSFKYHYMLVGIGANKKACSFFVMSSTLLKEIAEDLKGYKCNTGTIYFNPEDKLPVALIKKIVKLRLKENEERAKK